MKKYVNGVPPPSVALVSPGAKQSEAERSDAERSVAPGETKTVPNPEVVVRAKRRQYTTRPVDEAFRQGANRIAS